MNLAGNKPQLAGSSKTALLANQYLSTCKICRYGIYAHQQRKWCRNPMGLIHTDCERQP